MGISITLIGYALLSKQCCQLRPEFVLTAEYLAQSPMNFPPFIDRIDPAPGSILNQGDIICVYVKLRPLGSAISTASDLIDHARSNAHFQINHRPSNAHVWVFYIDGANSDRPVSDEVVELCPEWELENGIYMAEVTIKSLSGTTYSYTWSFYVAEANPSSTLTITDTP